MKEINFTCDSCGMKLGEKAPVTVKVEKIEAHACTPNCLQEWLKRMFDKPVNK